MTKFVFGVLLSLVCFCAVAAACSHKPKAHELTSWLDASPGELRSTTADFEVLPNSLAIYEVQ
jgi:hypothetical protein